MKHIPTHMSVWSADGREVLTVRRDQVSASSLVGCGDDWWGEAGPRVGPVREKVKKMLRAGKSRKEIIHTLNCSDSTIDIARRELREVAA